MTAAGEKIKAEGEMLAGKRGSAGPAIYFAESEAVCRQKARSCGYLIKAKVYIGRSKTLNPSQMAMQRATARENAQQSSRHYKEGYWRRWGLVVAGGVTAMLVLSAPVLIVVGGVAAVAASAVVGTAHRWISERARENARKMDELVEGSMNTNFEALHEAGYDSVFITGFASGVEYAVFNSDQVEILRVKKMSGDPQAIRRTR